ncbi:MAG TPA: P1 family peptidase [Bdellovibrionota bacterium]|nr:P1 family peptidase [Bdellovibrionota bacterium]
MTDIAGIRVGHSMDRKGCTGVTVIRFGREGAAAACETRGGAPGTRETDVLAPGNLVQRIHAIVLAGGSAFGLDAAAGVMRRLEKEKIGYRTPAGVVPIVPAAIIYDLAIGQSKIRPDGRMGEAACRNASRREVAQGNIGAGFGATVGKILGMGWAMKGGLGSASLRIQGGTVVAALVIVNALGDVVDPRTGRILAGARGERKGEFLDTEKFFLTERAPRVHGRTNTTIGVVAVDADYDPSDLFKMAQMAHDGISRSTRPSHTLFDGDTIFSLSVPRGRRQKPSLTAVGAAMACVVERAIVNAVECARSVQGIPARNDDIWRSTKAGQTSLSRSLQRSEHPPLTQRRESAR